MMDGLEVKSVAIQQHWLKIQHAAHEMMVVVSTQPIQRSDVEQLIYWQATIGTMQTVNINQHQVAKLATVAFYNKNANKYKLKREEKRKRDRNRKTNQND